MSTLTLRNEIKRNKMQAMAQECAMVGIFAAYDQKWFNDYCNNQAVRHRRLISSYIKDQ